MDLRHLRYFVAVAEEGSVTVAATRRLFTSQPSLSRQIRDLEDEVGTPLMTRGVRGVELTAAGRAFLDHARLALAQVEAAAAAARRAAQPARASFALGFLTGQEVEWLPQAMQWLGTELPKIEVTVSSRYSPDLATALSRRELDAAFMRPEAAAHDLVFHVVAREPLVVVLPSDHPLSANASVDPRELKGERFIALSGTAPFPRQVIDDYLKRLRLRLVPEHEVDNLAMAISLVASTRGVALLPAYVEKLLPWSVVSRPIRGESPTVELVLGHHRANDSPVLQAFLARMAARGTA